MAGQSINADIMDYMVWVVELAAGEFWSGDKTLAYNTLKNHGVWDLYVQNYDVTHSLGASYVVDEIREILLAKGAL